MSNTGQFVVVFSCTSHGPKRCQGVLQLLLAIGFPSCSNSSMTREDHTYICRYKDIHNFTVSCFSSTWYQLKIQIFQDNNKHWIYKFEDAAPRFREMRMLILKSSLHGQHTSLKCSSQITFTVYKKGLSL